MGTDTEDEFRRLRAAGVYLWRERRLFRSLLGLRLRLLLGLRVRLRLLPDEYRRPRPLSRSLLRLNRRSSRDVRAFATSAIDSLLCVLDSSDEGFFRLSPLCERDLEREKSGDLVLDREADDPLLFWRRLLGGGDRDELWEDTDRCLFRSRLGERDRDDSLRLMDLDLDGLRLLGLLRSPRSGDTEPLAERRRRRSGGDRDDDGVREGDRLGDLDGRRPLREPDGT